VRSSERSKIDSEHSGRASRTALNARSSKTERRLFLHFWGEDRKVDHLRSVFEGVSTEQFSGINGAILAQCLDTMDRLGPD
jgi:hypothetical protein